MNKRIKNKIIKRNNLARQENILSEISNVFNIDSKRFGDGYFLSSMGINSVCHFTLKETPNWLYGIWLNKNKGYEIFGENIELIDKFKPSRTYISFENNTIEFINIVKKISENPKLYFVDSLTDGDALIDYKRIDFEDGDFYYTGYQSIREFNDETQLWNKFRRDENITKEDFVNKEWTKYFERKEQRLKDEEYDRLYAFNLFKFLTKIDNVIAVGIKDGNKKGWSCSPRYSILVVYDNTISSEEFEILYEDIYNLIEEKKYSKERKTYEHQFYFSGLYDNLKDIKKCDYKYYKMDK